MLMILIWYEYIVYSRSNSCRIWKKGRFWRSFFWQLLTRAPWKWRFCCRISFQFEIDISELLLIKSPSSESCEYFRHSSFAGWICQLSGPRTDKLETKNKQDAHNDDFIIRQSIQRVHHIFTTSGCNRNQCKCIWTMSWTGLREHKYPKFPPFQPWGTHFFDCQTHLNGIHAYAWLTFWQHFSISQWKNHPQISVLTTASGKRLHGKAR